MNGRPGGREDHDERGSAQPAGGRAPRWYDQPRQLAAALLASGRGGARRVHTFQLPPGILGGIYAASFADAEGVHRCLVAYADPALLEASLKPFREAVAASGVPVVDGRVEVGRNTGEVLHYFLPNVGEADPRGVVRARRETARRAWLAAAGAEASELRRLGTPDAGTVLCASGSGHHHLLRLDDTWQADIVEIAELLGLPLSSDLSPTSPLGRDILGEWLDP